MLPIKAYKLAEQHRLGMPRGVYRSVRGHYMWLFLVLAVFFIIAGLAFFILHYIVFYPAVSVDLVVLSIDMLPCSLAALFRTISYPDEWIYTFTDGLVQVKWGRTQVVRWYQIESLEQKEKKREVNIVRYSHGSYRRTIEQVGMPEERKYVLNRSNEKPLLLNGFLNTKHISGPPNTQELWKMLEDEVVERLLPLALASYKAARAVTFGNITVSQQGISYKQICIPIYEVVYMYVDLGDKDEISMWRRNDRDYGFTIFYTDTDVANAGVLLALLDAVVGKARSV